MSFCAVSSLRPSSVEAMPIDLDMLSGYCAGWSLRTLLNEGLNGIPEKAEAGPPRHFSAALGQAVNFLGALQNEWAGAQAFSSFDTYMAPFVRVDGLAYEEVRQGLQEFVHSLNVPSRWGTQTPFTNLTFDWTCPEDLREQVPFIGGREADFVYGDLQAEMDRSGPHPHAGHLRAAHLRGRAGKAHREAHGARAGLRRG